MSDADWSKQFKNQNGLVNQKDNGSVQEGVTKKETAFKDLSHSIKITQDYVDQLKKEGKPSREQLVAELAKRLELADGNVGTVLKQLRMEKQLRDKQLEEAKLVNNKPQEKQEELQGYDRGLQKAREKMQKSYIEIIRAVDLYQVLDYQKMAPVIEVY